MSKEDKEDKKSEPEIPQVDEALKSLLEEAKLDSEDPIKISNSSLLKEFRENSKDGFPSFKVNLKEIPPGIKTEVVTPKAFAHPNSKDILEDVANKGGNTTKVIPKSINIPKNYKWLEDGIKESIEIEIRKGIEVIEYKIRILEKENKKTRFLLLFVFLFFIFSKFLGL